MRIAVWGATGGTGLHLVADALAAGNEVTAVVRDPSRLTIPVAAGGARESARHEPPAQPRPARPSDQREIGSQEWIGDCCRPAGGGNRRRSGSVRNRAGHRWARRDHLRSRPAPQGQGADLRPGAEAIIAAMRGTGVRRLVVITASGRIQDSHDDFATRALAKPILRRLLRSTFADFAATDEVVTASGLDWTLMRPSRLTDGGHKPYRTALDHTVRGGNTISRADLATATLAAAADPATIGRAVTIGY